MSALEGESGYAAEMAGGPSLTRSGHWQANFAVLHNTA